MLEFWKNISEIIILGDVDCASPKLRRRCHIASYAIWRNWGFTSAHPVSQQQVAVLKESVKRPKLRSRDRVFWAWLSGLRPNWRSALVLVKPETIIKRQRQGFRLYRRWKSGAGKLGHPRSEREIRDLIRCMSRENPTWGASQNPVRTAPVGPRYR